MKAMKLIIDDPIGLHARPVSTLVTTAQQYESQIVIHHNGKTANARSIISVLRLGAHHGEQIELVIDGEDADEAHHALETLFETELKEEFSILPD